MIDYYLAKSIMGKNIVGPDEIKKLDRMSLHTDNEDFSIDIPQSVLEAKKDDYILIFGADEFSDKSPVTIRNIIKRFGKDPSIFEPCFYNQDWYENELFLDKKIGKGWYLIRKNVYEGSRAVSPEKLIGEYDFPSAISCTYAFFVVWLALDIKLWYHDFVWCSDVDHNGDRIYVGKYNDIDGINKNGFSIHRHLGLRKCYGAID